MIIVNAKQLNALMTKMQADAETCSQELWASTYTLNSGHDADDLTIDGFTVGYDVTNSVVVIAWLDRQMDIALVLIGIPVCVRLHRTSVLIYTQLTHT